MHPFLWLPSGVVSSLEDLSALGSAPAQSDVSFSVNGKDSGHHHLTVAELADGKIIGDLRLVATADDVVVGGCESLFGCAEARSHYLLHRRRLRMPKYRQGTALLLGISQQRQLLSLAAGRVLSVCSAAEDHHLAALAELTTPVEVEVHRTFVMAGEPANYLFNITEGS